MAITVIETITLTTPIGEGIYRKDFQSFLWVHIDKAPWRDQISFDVFGQGGLVILTPGDANGHTDVRVINQSSGLTNIPVDSPGEQLIRGIYKQTSTDPGVEFWISILVGGIDYNPSSTFPEERDDFGPMKRPAVAADLPAIDYYQYLISSSIKSKADLEVLKSLKESLTPKMILAKDINWLRNSILAVQKAYYDLKERLKRLEGELAKLAEELGLLERAFKDLHDYVHDDLTPRVVRLEEDMEELVNTLLPNGLRSARNNTMKRVYVNLPLYGTGGPSQKNQDMKDNVTDSQLFHPDNSYSMNAVDSNIILDEYFKTLIVHSGSPSGSNKVIIQNNRIAMFRHTATESQVKAGTNYEAMLSIGANGNTVLDMAQSSGTGTINIGKGRKMWMHGNPSGGWVSAGESPEDIGPGIAMTPQSDGASFTQLGLMATHMTWTRVDGGSGLVNWGYGGANVDPYIYQSFGIGSSDGESQGFAIVKSESGGAILVFTDKGGKSCGIRMSINGLEIWGEGGTEEPPAEVAGVLKNENLINDMHGGAYHDPRKGING